MTAPVQMPPADCHLSKQCLDGEDEALKRLLAWGLPVAGTLRGYGAHRTLAEDIANDVLDDAVADRRLLTTFSGRCRAFQQALPCEAAGSAGDRKAPCSLFSWLKRTALRRWYDHMRRARRVEPALPRGGDDNASDPLENIPEPTPASPLEDPIRQLLETAVRAGFAACPSEEFVMLMLKHAGRVKQKELSRMWGYSESQISRRMDEAMVTVRRAIMKSVRQQAPWMTISFESLFELLLETLGWSTLLEFDAGSSGGSET